MANYYGTTVSEGGKLKKDSKPEVDKIIEKYAFGNESGLTVRVNEDNEIEIYGDDSTYAYLAEDEDHDEDCMDDFLNELSPFIEETLIVKEVGNEKCRYVNAYAYVLEPNKKVESISLDEAITNLLNKTK